MVADDLEGLVVGESHGLLEGTITALKLKWMIFGEDVIGVADIPIAANTDEGEH